MSNSQIGRYQQKVRQGLVPSNYNRDSKDFHRGAWKNWERVIGFSPERHPQEFNHHRNGIAFRDAEVLKRVRAEQ